MSYFSSIQSSQPRSNQRRSMDWFHPIVFVYLVLITAAEIIMTVAVPKADATIYGFIQLQYVLLLFVLCIHAAVRWDKADFPLLLSLMMVPLIRIISLSLPLQVLPQIYWYLVTSIPIFVAAFMIMRQLDWSWRDMGINGRYPLWQILIIFTGFGIGTIEYFILRPKLLIPSLSWVHVLSAGLILLIGTGFLEELVFRRIMQETAVKRLGKTFGIIYIAAIFAVLHIGYNSFIDVLFVFAIGLFYGWAVDKTGSIVGVTFSHGLANFTLFIILPAFGMPTPISIVPVDMSQLIQDNTLWIILLVAGFGMMRLLMQEPELLD